MCVCVCVCVLEKSDGKCIVMFNLSTYFPQSKQKSGTTRRKKKAF